MYRLYLITLLMFTEAKWYQYKNGYHKPIKAGIDNLEAVVEELAKHLIIADDIISNTCNENYNERETYDFDGYNIKYKLRKELEEHVNIKIRNNVMVMKGGFREEIFAMKVLPSHLKTEDAIWWNDGKDLVITIPYKVQSGLEIPMKCEKSYVEIDVPQSPQNSFSIFLNSDF